MRIKIQLKRVEGYNIVTTLWTSGKYMRSKTRPIFIKRSDNNMKNIWYQTRHKKGDQVGKEKAIKRCENYILSELNKIKNEHGINH